MYLLKPTLDVQFSYGMLLEQMSSYADQIPILSCSSHYSGFLNYIYEFWLLVII